MSYIFISYSHKDKEYAGRLAELLEGKGFPTWLDDRIDYGTQWPQAIQENLDKCDAFVVLVSENSYKSEWVQNEVARAKRKRKPFFPLLLSGEPWISLETTQYIDVRGLKLPPPNFYEQLAKFVEPYSDIEERRYSSLAGEWPKYVNKHFGFSFHYPFEGQLVEETENRVIIGFDRVERTNLSEKRITVTCVEGDDCSGYLTEKQDPLEGIQSNHTINGRSFIVVSRQGAAMSKYYDVTTYSTRLGKACITIELHLRFVSSGPFWPHLITQVDLESEKELIRYVAASFAVE